MEVIAAQPATALQDDRRTRAARGRRYGDRAAIRYKRDGEWQDVSYAELDEIVAEIGARPDRSRHRTR